MGKSLVKRFPRAVLACGPPVSQPSAFLCIQHAPAFKLIISGLPVFGFNDFVFKAMKDSKCFSKSDHVMSGRYLNKTT